MRWQLWTNKGER